MGMIEFIFVLYILLLFIFPVPTLSASLGVVTCYFLFRKHYLFKHQPKTERKLLWVDWVCGVQNFALSLGLALLLSMMVYFLIFNNYFLFIFNFILCFAISIRWFDYSYNLVKSSVLRRFQGKSLNPESTTFAMVIGMRPHSGLGLGLAPVFLDAGPVLIGESTIRFEGTFFQEVFRPGQFTDIQKVSAEKVRIVPLPSQKRFHATEYWLVIRDQFYPFRCRPQRDRIFSTLAPQTETQSEPSRLGANSPQPWPSTG